MQKVEPWFNATPNNFRKHTGNTIPWGEFVWNCRPGDARVPGSSSTNATSIILENAKIELIRH
jgi:hypothetical protein